MDMKCVVVDVGTPVSCRIQMDVDLQTIASSKTMLLKTKVFRRYTKMMVAK
jgi:hypothetical protein